jgi:cholest-4-en-3-one 26-monooxygenase
VRRFTPRAVHRHEHRVREVVTEILDGVVPLGECEAIAAVASTLPAIMIGDLLGYPRAVETRPVWSEQVMLLAGQTSPDGPPHVIHPGIMPVVQEFIEVTTGVIEERRAEPSDDLISLWTHTEGWDLKRVLDESDVLLSNSVLDAVDALRSWSESGRDICGASSPADGSIGSS